MSRENILVKRKAKQTQNPSIPDCYSRRIHISHRFICNTDFVVWRKLVHKTINATTFSLQAAHLSDVKRQVEKSEQQQQSYQQNK